MEMSRAERIRVLKELKDSVARQSIDGDTDYFYALTDSIAEAELMEKAAEGMPKDWEKKFDERFVGESFYEAGDSDVGLTDPTEQGIGELKKFIQEQIDLCQSHWASRVGEIEKKVMEFLDISEKELKWFKGLKQWHCNCDEDGECEYCRVGAVIKWTNFISALPTTLKPSWTIDEDKLWDILVCFGENYGDVKLEDTDRYVREGLNKIKQALLGQGGV
jgi:hypothetical protein